MNWRILTGDCIEQMRELPDESIDAVVTDPPYGIGFMGHEWDQPGEYQGDRVGQGGSRGHWSSNGKEASGAAMNAGRYDLPLTANQKFQRWTEAWAREAFRVLKPGGHLLSFAGTRTYHRMTSGIEDAGLEVRDCIAWLFGSGFPKGTDKNKIPEDWEGWNTALKPAFEPIAVARKPLIGTVAANLIRHGTGAVNVDGCRIEVEDEHYARNHSGDRGHAGTRTNEQRGATDLRPGGGSASENGRWPANLVLDPEAGAMLDEQTGQLTSGFMAAGQQREGIGYHGGLGNTVAGDTYGDTGGASRFFYCAKTSRAERDAGLEAFAKKPLNWSNGEESPGTFQAEGVERTARNAHPTVKPIALMRWLIRLVTPPGGALLDPFNGSGSTGCAAVLEGFDYIGIDREPEYVAIAEARIKWWEQHPEGVDVEDGLKAERKRQKVAESGQMGMFDEAAA